MKLTNYLYIKLIKSTLFSLSILQLIFFIFSLLGGLGENNSFLNILKISYLTSLQIFLSIPILIFFLVILTFLIKMKSGNELQIASHYLKKSKLIILIFPLILIIYSIEVNKSILIEYFEDIKYSINNKNKINDKLIIVKSNNFNEYHLINKNEFNKIKSINIFKKFNNRIEAIFSDDTQLTENKIFLNNYYILLNDTIKFKNQKLVINFEIDRILNNKKIQFINKKKIQYNFKDIQKYILIFLILNLITILILEKKNLSKNSNLKYLGIINMIVIFYSYLVINLKLNYFDDLFSFFSILVIFLLILVRTKYE